MRYAMLIMETEAGRAIPGDHRDEWYKRIFGWYSDLESAGRAATGGAELQGTDTARTIRGKTVTDGPFVEAKEVIGGVDLFEASDIDDAVEVAKSWPGVAEGWITIEVRPTIAH